MQAVSELGKECFWLCVEAGWQYRQHVLQRTGRDCAQLWRSGVSWFDKFDIATAWLAEHSLDWRWKFNAHVWMDATAGIAIGSRRGFGRVKHIDTVFRCKRFFF